MENFEKIDGSLKKKLDAMEFSFNEANWEKASQMIDASRPIGKQKTSFLLMASIITGAVLIIASSIYFMKNPINENSMTAETTTAEKSIEKNDIRTSIHSVNESEIGSSEKSSISSETKNIHNTQYKSETLNKNSQTHSTNNPLRNTEDATVQKTVKQNNKLNISQKTNQANTSLVTKTSSASIKNKDLTASKSQNMTEIENSNLIQPLEEVGSLSANSITSENEDMNENKMIANENLLSQNTLTTVAANETILQPDTSTQTIKADYVKTSHHQINIIAGANNSFGWLVNNKRNGNSLTPLFGLNYIYSFNSKSAISIGAQYNSISNLSESKASFSVTSFDFGVNNDVTTYKITDLQYISMPIKYIHNVSKNSAIGVGINATYLFNIKNKIETFKTIESNIEVGETKTDNGYGYNTTNNFNAQLALSYHHKLNNKLGLDLELNRNVLNVFKDYQFYNCSAKTNKPLALKLSLTYSLFYK